MSTVLINGVPIHYQVKGRGIPIVFIHPPLLTSAVFAYQQLQLPDEFQVITFDIRGHGQSGASKAPVTYSVIAEDIRLLLNHLKLPKAYLCGYSTGGAIALEAILAHPELYAGAIVLSGMSEVSTLAMHLEIRLARLLSGGRPFIDWLGRAVAWGNADNPHTYRNLLRDARRGNRVNIRQYYAASERYTCTDRLSRIRHPVLLVYGGKDRRFRKYSQILKECLPVNEMIKIPGVSHQLPTKAANALNTIIREWVREQEGTLNAERAELRFGEPAGIAPGTVNAAAAAWANDAAEDAPADERI